MIDKILEISPKNLAIQFIHERLKSKNYRGIHLVQHARYTYPELIGCLLAIYAVVGESKLRVPKGDPVSEDDVKDFPEFKNMVEIYRATFEKGKYKSMKKINFLNLARMGFLDRLDEKNNIIPISKKASKMDAIILNELGKKILFEPKNSRYIFTKGLDFLFDGYMSEILNLLQSKELKGKINEDEFFLFVSYIGFKLDNSQTKTNIHDIEKYILEYRKLKKHEKTQIIDFINKLSSKTKNKGKNKGYIDKDNWKNQTQSIFNLLSFTANLTVNNGDLIYGKKRTGTQITLERSIKEKELYFSKHSINVNDWKKKGYELHHIYPLAYASNDDEFLKIDSWDNLIYIDGKKHAEITQKRNKHIKLEFDNANIKLQVPNNENDVINAIKNENVIYNESNKTIMKSKNDDLLNL